MTVSADLAFEVFSTVQSNLQQYPTTIASTTAAFTPTQKLTFLTGTQQLTNITPPATGYVEITLCFTDGSPGAFLTTGNIKTAYTPIQNRPIDLCYDPISAKWWVKAVV